MKYLALVLGAVVIFGAGAISGHHCYFVKHFVDVKCEEDKCKCCDCNCCHCCPACPGHCQDKCCPK